MTQQPSRFSWGFAVTSAGTLVIRNWYFLFGWLLTACLGLFLSLSLLGNSRNEGAGVFGLLLGVYALWSFYLEVRGVEVRDRIVWYPVRLGIGIGIFPLFRKMIPIELVLQASPLRWVKGIWIAYLSGEFGQAKILFDTKGGRDRFFAILKSRFPHIRVYRWT